MHLLQLPGHPTHLSDCNFVLCMLYKKTAIETGCFILSPCVGLRSVNPMNVQLALAAILTTH